MTSARVARAPSTKATEVPMPLYAGIVGACWISFFVIWAVASIAYGGGTWRYSGRNRGIRLLMFVALLIAIGAGNRLPRVSLAGWPNGVAAAGAALSILGLVFASWARVVLGRSWGMPMTLRDDTKLVTSGPYVYVRHPIYTGMASMAVGTTLVYPLAVVWCVLMLVYFVVSVRREERDMEQLFPDEWPAYRQRSKMLVPFVL